MDNLQSTTYQTFEQDPVKYQKYEEVSGDLISWINKSAMTCHRRYSLLYLNGHRRNGCESIDVESLHAFNVVTVPESFA